MHCCEKFCSVVPYNYKLWQKMKKEKMFKTQHLAEALKRDVEKPRGSGKTEESHSPSCLL